MSFVPSLVLYNPLEAFVLILFCDIFTKRKFKMFDIIHCYALGIINFSVQCMRIIFPSDITMLFYDVFSTFILMTFVLFVYYNILIKQNVKLKYCAMAILFAFITLSLTLSIINPLFDFAYTSMGFDNMLNEFVVNIIVKILQLCFIKIIKERVNVIGKSKEYIKVISK